MYVKTSRTFVYGELHPLGLGRALSRSSGDAEPEFAIEIMREHSANEFVGKLYRKSSSGNWVPVDPGVLSGPAWRQRFSEKTPMRFEMAGSGVWKVLHFRTESDETGPYVAIALQYAD